MAKYPHRLFEMYDFRDEAVTALTPRRTPPVPEAIAPQSWTLKHLTVSRSASVTHVEFKSAEVVEEETARELHKDFAQLADELPRDSKVLLDFAGVTSFSAASIKAISVFKQELSTKGSRIALCRLDPAVRESFFATRSP